MFLRVYECSNDFCKRRFLQVQNAKTAPFSVGIFVDLRSGRENIAPMKRRYISFVAAVLLCGCACVETPEPADFTVASFNVGFCKDPSDVRRWDVRKNLIMPLVEFHGFDIVGMQEPMGFQVDYLAAQSDKYAVAGQIVRNLTLAEVSEKSAAKNIDNMLRNMNNPIFYRRDKFELLDSGKFYFSETPDKAERGFGGQFDSIRSCVWAKFRHIESGREFHFFNIHLCVEKYAKWHKPAAELLVKKIREIAKGGTFFVSGDFNETRSQPASLVMRGSSIAKDARENSLSKPYGTTRSTFNNYKNVSEGDMPIDFIYVSNDVAVLNFGTYTDHVDGLVPSDHYPISARIVLR